MVTTEMQVTQILGFAEISEPLKPKDAKKLPPARAEAPTRSFHLLQKDTK